MKENGSDISVKREDVVRVSTTSVPKRGEHAGRPCCPWPGYPGANIGAAAGSSHGFLGGGGSWRGVGALIGGSGLVLQSEQLSAPSSSSTTVYRAPPDAARH